MSSKSEFEGATSSLSKPSDTLHSNLFNNLPFGSQQDLVLGLLTAIDQTGSYIFMKDLAGRYIYVNQKVQELFNAKFDDIVGKDDSHFFNLELANGFLINDRRVLDQGETLEQEEMTVAISTGENRIYWSVKKPVRNGDGEIIGMCGVSTDITDRKKSEEMLLKSSEELRESQLIAGLGTYVLDIRTGIWTSSSVLDQIFGIDQSY